MSCLSTGLAASLLLAACSDDGGAGSTSSDGGRGASDERAAVATVKKSPLVAGKDRSQMSVEASAALFSSGPVAVLLAGSTEQDVALASSAGVALGVPVLVTGSPDLMPQHLPFPVTTCWRG